MDTSFYAYFMRFNGSGTPVLTKESTRLQPINRFTHKNSAGKIYLAGGFTSFSKQTEVPLSPTLQLNGDLGSFSIDELQKIGLAELNKQNATTYRSSILEPDSHVAVLAQDADSLTNFLETYGGVLEIEPLLIGSYHPDYATADELGIESLQEGCRIHYMVRKPIDLDKCTYCAACGPVCLENCLDEHLFVDMSRCSYCNACITACPVEAIDLYRVEKYSLEFPALVLLDQPEVTPPNDQSHIYKSEALEELFSSLVPLSIEETITWTSSCCQCSTRENGGCTACLDVCRHDALKQNQDTIAINYKNCVECGACLASCPTGALQYQRFTDQQFIDWFSTVELEANSTIILGSEQELHRLWWKRNGIEVTPVLYLEYPNIRTLTSMHLLFLLSLGADRVILLDEPSSCREKPIASQVWIANTIFSTLFGGAERITIAPSSLLQDSEPTPLQNLYFDFSFINRREKLGSILSFLLTQAPDQNTVLAEEPFLAFGSVDCDGERCTHCGACLNECRIEALTTYSETLSLDHRAILCVQCSKCVDVCPENALTIKSGLLLAQTFFVPQELTRAEPINCLECGKPFGTQKSYDRIMTILKAQNADMMEQDVLEYCETCRVVKLFEAHQQ